MEVKNGIIDEILHEAVNYSSSNISCNTCSLREQCDKLEERFDERIYNIIDYRYFINRGKVTDIKIDKEEQLWKVKEN